VPHPHAAPAIERTLWRRVATVAVLAGLLATFAVVAPDPAHADRNRDAEAWLTAAIDRERTDRGLPRMRTAGDMADVAAHWSSHMAARDRVTHNPSYADQICCWTVVLENVGMVSGIEARGGLQAALREAHRLFMGSGGHRNNILHRDINEVGVGVYVADDKLWVTQNFRHRPGTTSPVPAPSPAPPPPPSTSDAGSGSNEGAARTAAASRHAFDPREVQRRLAEFGWYSAPIDGIVGPLTRRAVADFKGATGLDADGRIDTETLSALAGDDPAYRWGAGRWADPAAAFAALRQLAREIRGIEGPHATAVEEHPVLAVLDRVVEAQRR
jgi:uncharacterized protein YkwD